MLARVEWMCPLPPPQSVDAAVVLPVSMLAVDDLQLDVAHFPQKPPPDYGQQFQGSEYTTQPQRGRGKIREEVSILYGAADISLDPLMFHY